MSANRNSVEKCNKHRKILENISRTGIQQLIRKYITNCELKEKVRKKVDKDWNTFETFIQFYLGLFLQMTYYLSKFFLCMIKSIEIITFRYYSCLCHNISKLFRCLTKAIRTYSFSVLFFLSCLQNGCRTMMSLVSDLVALSSSRLSNGGQIERAMARDWRRTSLRF